jgi:hypothetical protein
MKVTGNMRKLFATVAAVAAFAAGGAVMANAASTDTTATTTPSASAQPRQAYPAHGTAAHEALEKPVTGDAAAKAKAAALALVGSGTAGDVTTDVSGSGYEVTVTKADGSSVEIHLDSSFNAFLGGHGAGR